MNHEIGKQVPTNPEWARFSSREYRMPYQFGGIGDNGDGKAEVSHILSEESFAIDEVAQLKERGAIFPLETAEPCRTPRMQQYLDAVNRIKVNDAKTIVTFE